MGRARSLLTAFALLCAVIGVFAATHDHEHGSEDGVVCSVCLVGYEGDEVAPPHPPALARGALSAPAVQAFAAILAVRPPKTVVPPGRAPPLTR